MVALKPGGHIIIDTKAAETLFAAHHAQDWAWWGEGSERVRVCQERIWNALTGRMETEWTFIRGQEMRVCQTSVRIYACHELVSLLKSAGCGHFECTDYDKSPFRIGASRLWLTAQKL